MYKGMDVISALQFSRSDVEKLITIAEELRRRVENGEKLELAKGRILFTAFFEPSTRTRLSFQFAMAKLGGNVIDLGPEEVTSRAKGESPEDTLRTVDSYDPDIIVVRHREPGFAAKAAEICRAPVVNAGDGYNEHPTQALLDVYTIWRSLGRIDGVTIGIMGDLKYGRTISSLSYILSNFRDVTIYFISPQALRPREEVLKILDQRRTRYELLEKPDDAMEKLNILYVTRLQKERMNPEEYERLKGSYIITYEYLSRFKKIPMIMHPLPRVWELTTDVDVLPQAIYFEQAKNGLYMRMALIKIILGV
ncbi:aspartate carbamoyltransferase catalytic subunit [Desulfurococcus amylolyticus 1221n]|uniref:Aspartate carbamoyltransferase n=1 Tax=Desulfurococcus amylolyticus (strain DSM 18924 / JCM 16383 / VKM B-2413 / 1221n) TaxID=490899 RepID=B8D4N7_DESA1|nr:aspartate carbamoyltransferase [Desulfurococcus amylolyticus]ACL11068.1 aspartate carbamoyltransferase catalytic subunit [Desulfurococcus amylolyticus 1221n]